MKLAVDTRRSPIKLVIRAGASTVLRGFCLCFGFDFLLWPDNLQLPILDCDSRCASPAHKVSGSFPDHPLGRADRCVEGISRWQSEQDIIAFLFCLKGDDGVICENAR